MKTKNKLILCLFLFSCFANRLSAIQFNEIPLETIINSSSYIFEGTVISKTCFAASDSVIYTSNVIQISKILKSGGTLSCGNVEIITLGGELAHRGTYIPGNLEFNVGAKGIFMCIVTGRPSLLAPIENPTALQVYANVQGYIAYEQINATTTLYHWYWEDLPSLTAVYSYVESLTGYSYTTCSYEKHKTESVDSIIDYEFENEKVTTVGGNFLEFDIYARCTQPGTFLYDAQINFNYNDTAFGSYASGTTTATNIGNFAFGYNSATVGDHTISDLSIEILSDGSSSRIELGPDAQPLCHVKMQIFTCTAQTAGLEIENIDQSYFYNDPDSGSEDTYTFGANNTYDGPLCPSTMSISGFSPSSVVGGDFSYITITGSGFGTSKGSSNVVFTDVQATNHTMTAIADSFKSWSPSVIEVYVPSFCTDTMTKEHYGIAATGYFEITHPSVEPAKSSSPLTISHSLLNYRFEDSRLLADTPVWINYFRNLNTLGGMTFYLNYSDFSSESWEKFQCFNNSARDWTCKTGINIRVSSSFTRARLNPTDDTCSISLATLDPGTIMQTSINYDKCDNGGGYVKFWTIDADIQIDTSFHKYYINPTHTSFYCPSNEFDFRTAIEHEMGHAIGLEHTLNTGDMMYPELPPANYFTLSANDIAGGEEELDSGEATFSPLSCNQHPCSAFSGSCTQLSIDNSANINQISMFPNPFKDEININVTGPLYADGKIVITDIQGKIVYQYPSDIQESSTTLNLAFLPTGVYVLRYYAQNNCDVVKICKL